MFLRFLYIRFFLKSLQMRAMNTGSSSHSLQEPTGVTAGFTNQKCPHYPHRREPCISIRHRQGIGLQTSYLYNDICIATPVFRNTPFVNEKHFLSLRSPLGQLHIDESVFAFILAGNLANFNWARISNSFITLYGYSDTLLR